MQGPLVAIIDSGVDYNHPALNERLWTNPAPITDPDGNTDTYGWDFISGDPRPFDDGYHGTEVASAVVGVAPLVTIMPLKVFNPFGITNSAAIYGAFQYAVDHGAKIIVAAWASQLPTTTLDMSVKYAHDHGVSVVVSAGDRGDDLSKNPSYPAALSKKYDNVVTVAGVDTTDALVKVQFLLLELRSGLRHDRGSGRECPGRHASRSYSAGHDLIGRSRNRRRSARAQLGCGRRRGDLLRLDQGAEEPVPGGPGIGDRRFRRPQTPGEITCSAASN